jgi:sulfate permease, SulP family
VVAGADGDRHHPGPDSSLAPLIAAAILPLAAGSEAEDVALAGLLAILSGPAVRACW